MSDGADRVVRRCPLELAGGQADVCVAGSLTDKPTLVCLDRAAQSACSFAAILPHLAQDRLAIAPDIPRREAVEPQRAGQSLAVEDYASAVWQAVNAFTTGPVHFIGYHAGAMVAVAATLLHPRRVVRVINISAPLFTSDELRALRPEAAPSPFDEAAHRAVLAYSEGYARALSKLAQPLLVMNIRDDLYEITKRVDALLRNGVRRDYTDWGDGFLQSWPQTVAWEMLMFLDPEPIYSASATS